MRQWLLSRYAWPQDSGGNPDPPVNISGPNNQWLVSPHRPLTGDDLRVSVPNFYAAGNITFFLPLLNGQHTLTLFNPTGYGDQPGLTARATLYWYRFVGGFWSVQDSVVVNVTDTDGLKNGGYAVFEFPMTTFSLAAGDLLTFNVQAKKTSPTYLGDILFRTDESYVDSVYPLAVAQVGVMEINGGYQEFYAPATVSVDVNPVYSQIIEPTAAWIYVDVWGPIEGTPAPVSVVVRPVTSLIVPLDPGTPAGISVDVGAPGSEISTDQTLVLDDDPWTSSASVGLRLTAGLPSTTTYPPAPSLENPDGIYVLARPSVTVDAEVPTIVDGVPVDWEFDETFGERYTVAAIKVWDTVQTDATDITWFRGKATVISSWQKVDPFGHSIATIVMPQCTRYDGPWADPGTNTVPSATWWLKAYVNVDIYTFECTTEQWHEGEAMVVHPLTNKKTLYVHELHEDGSPVLPTWEGWVYRANPSADGWELSCKGALWQLDNYQSKPMNPLRPKPIEQMIARYFDPARRGLWTKPLRWDLTGWTKTYTAEDEAAYLAQGPRYVPTGIDVGEAWTGFNTRVMGNWSKALTGYVQQMLGMLYADPSWGVDIADGDQWTIGHEPGRQPVLKLRRQSAPTRAVAMLGQHGVEADLTDDSSTVYNVLFLVGKDVGNTGWQKVEYLQRGTAVVPAQVPAYPPAGIESLYVGDKSQVIGYDSQGRGVANDLFTNYDGYFAAREREDGSWVVENYFQMPDGVSQEDGLKIAEKWVARNREAGWQGTIELAVDLRDLDGNLVSRWDLEPGDVITLLGHAGAWDETAGVNRFHIAQVDASWARGSVTLTVDTKFRDMLSIDMAIAQGRDSLAPINSLRVGQRSAMIEDLAAPWDDEAGSGCIPRESKSKVFTGEFPYTEKTTQPGNRPKDIFPSFYTNPARDPVLDTGAANHYVNTSAYLRSIADGKALYLPVCAGAKDVSARWGFLDNMLMASQGTISRFELAAYDRDGELAPVEIHCSLFYEKVFLTDMPRDPSVRGGGAHSYSALWDGAFEHIDRQTNRPWPDPGVYFPQGKTSPVGWGTFERPGGYSPGVNDGGPPTGKIVDGGPWTFDFSQQSEYSQYARSGDDAPPETAISLSVAIYCRLITPDAAQLTALGMTADEYATKYHWVYLRGRAYRNVTIGTGA